MTDADRAGGVSGLEVAATTHCGLVRSHNEDAVGVGRTVLQTSFPSVHRKVIARPAGMLLVVADGLGGRPAGEVASRHVASTLVRELGGRSPDEAAVRAALRLANEALYAAMNTAPSCVGMGSTVAGLLIDAASLVAFNVGDSRIYRLAGSDLQQISVDDREPRSGAITAALGGRLTLEEVRPHVRTLPLVSGETWLLCTDGATDLFGDETIREALALPPARAVDRLLYTALAAGGDDNVSVVVARAGA